MTMGILSWLCSWKTSQNEACKEPGHCGEPGSDDLMNDTQVIFLTLEASRVEFEETKKRVMKKSSEVQKKAEIIARKAEENKKV
jgi:hypothetical protein